MPPRKFSRYALCTGVQDAAGRMYLTRPLPYRFRQLPDNRHHTVAQGDTLWTLAARYFAAHPRPASLWWAIADFQPDPVYDPTVQLPVGSTVVVPSLRTVLELVLSPRRRTEEPL